MTTFAANLIGTVIFTAEPTNPALGLHVEPDHSLAWNGSQLVASTVDRHQPIHEVAQARAGNRFDGFGFLDWYERIHLSTLELDLGNVVSAQQVSVFAWNAFFVPHVLESLAAVGDDGLVLTQPGSPPLTYAPLQEREYLLNVATNGPATIDATFTFTFDVVEYDLHVVGVRIVAWQWEANWVETVKETLLWKTDVLLNYDGSEQRMQLRAGPTVTYEFTFDAADGSRRLLENVLFSWGARNWALPIWTDVTTLAAPLSSGSTFVPLVPLGLDYHDGGLGVIIGEAGAEAFEVSSVAVDGLNLSRAIVATWPTGSRVYPARTATLNDPRSTGRMTRNYARGLASLTTLEEVLRDPLVEVQYRNQPVLEVQPNWRDAPDLDYQRKLAVLTFGTGGTFVDDESELALPSQSFDWTSLSRADADLFRAWLYSRAGRAKGFWLPTWCDDLVVTSLTSPSGVNVEFEACGLVHFAASSIHRRDVRIELADGTVFYRRLTSPVTVDANTEQATMNAPFGRLVAPADVARVSWMTFARLDADSIELTWSTAGIVEAVVVTKAPRNDV